MISQCADNVAIVYADTGHYLLGADGHLNRAIASDGLHPDPAGYAAVSPEIARALKPLLGGR